MNVVCTHVEKLTYENTKIGNKKRNNWKTKVAWKNESNALALLVLGPRAPGRR